MELERRQVHLTVIELPATPEDVINAIGGDTVMIRGRDGDTDLLCGGCGCVLAVGVVPGVMAGVGLRCNGCGALNQT